MNYVLAEQADCRDELDFADLLSDEAKENRGTAKFGLMVVGETKSGGHKSVRFSCKNNESKFRPGDSVFLFDGKRKLGAQVIESEFEQIVVQVSRNTKLDTSQKWAIILQTAFFSQGVINALNSLAPGAPGWQYFSSIAGSSSFKKKDISEEEAAVLERKLEHFLLVHGLVLDGSQTQSVLKCLKLPYIHAVQGPPGTGKSKVLSVVASILTSLGKRVVITAPTHQAVNNALNTLNQTEPTLEIFKIGGKLKNESLSSEVKQETFSDFSEMFSKRNRKQANPVIGMTYHSLVFNLAGKVNSFAPNVILIDEAGQLSLPLGAVAGCCGAGSILLFGDDKQMPPIFSSSLKGHRLSVSLFGQLRNTGFEIISRLDTTYRMNARLCQVVGDLFYVDDLTGRGFLRSHEASSARLFKLQRSREILPPYEEILNEEDSLVWVNVPGKNSSQMNINEAEIASNIVQICLDAGLKAPDMAVITPFRMQAAEIRRKLLLKVPSLCIPIIDTVEKVQGASVEVIVISLVSSDAEYIYKMSNFLFSENRINVSVSRARTKVIVLSSEEMTSVYPSHYEALLVQNTLLKIKSFAKVVNVD